MAFLPSDAPAWDDGSNNRWLVSGKGAMIMNPPSAWAVAKRDAPQVAEQCWTHGFPAGPKGRFAPFLPYFWSIWNFSKNKEAAKSLLVASVASRRRSRRLVAASGGYDLPAFEKLTTLKTWAEEGPPKGTLYHYPNPYKHQILVDRGVAGATEDRPADLYAGDPDQDVPALSSGRSDGKDARLGGRRVRRLHAELSGISPRRPAGCGPPRRIRLPTRLRSRRTRRLLDVPKTHFVEINPRGRCIMADVALQPNSVAATQPARKRASLRTALKRKSTAAFLMTLPLILLIALLVIYPAFYSLHLATLNKSMQRFVGLGNFEFLFKRETFWLVVEAILHLRDHGRDLQSADRLHRRALRPQHSGQGPAQMARHAAGAVGDPAGDEHAGVAVAVRPLLQRLQLYTVVFRHRADPMDRRRRTGRASRSFWSTSGSARRSS